MPPCSSVTKTALGDTAKRFANANWMNFARLSPTELAASFSGESERRMWVSLADTIALFVELMQVQHLSAWRQFLHLSHTLHNPKLDKGELPNYGTKNRIHYRR